MCEIYNDVMSASYEKKINWYDGIYSNILFETMFLIIYNILKRSNQTDNKL